MNAGDAGEARRTLFPVRDAVLYVPNAAVRRRGQGVPGRVVLHRRQPAVRGDVHLPPEGGAQDAEAEAQGRGEGGREERASRRRTRRRRSCGRGRGGGADDAARRVATRRATWSARCDRPDRRGDAPRDWDLRDPAATLPTTAPARAEDDDDDSPRRAEHGPLVAPGKYTVRLFKRVEGKVTPLAGPVEFNVVLDTLGNPDAGRGRGAGRVPPAGAEALARGDRRDQRGTELGTRLDAIRRALDVAPKADEAAKTAVRAMIDRNRDILRALRGDTVLAARNENVPLSISDRASYAGRASGAVAREADGHAEGAVRHRRQGVRDASWRS